MKVLRKIVGKTKINRIRTQQIRESCDIHPIEWMERRRREWDENVMRMNAEKFVKTSGDNIPGERSTPRRSKRRRSDLIPG